MSAASAKVERDPVLNALDEVATETATRDAILLALQPAWRLADAEQQLCMDILEIHEGHRERTFPPDIQRAAEMTSPEVLQLRSDAAVDAKIALAECIFALPARTLDGILFKRKVLHNFGRGDRPAFDDSLSADLLALVREGEAQPATREQWKAA